MQRIVLFVLLTVMLVYTAHGATTRNTQQRIATLLGKSGLTETYKELLDALLEGAGVDNIVANSTECLHDVEHTYDDVGEAISHFVQRGWSWENYLDLNGALGDFTPLIRTCYNVTESSIDQARDHFGQFESFVDFANQAKNNAISHFMDWYDVYYKISEAIDKKRNKDVAFQVGRAFRLLLDFTPKMVNDNIEEFGELELPDLRPFEDFLKGFLNGTQILSSDKIKRCVNETEFMVASIEDANTQFRKGTDEGFKEGVFELADMFEHLRPLNEQCYNGIIDVEDIVKKYIKTFTSPLDIILNAARHFNQIYADALGVVQHCKNSEWKECGKDAGDVFYNIFFDH